MKELFSRYAIGCGYPMGKNLNLDFVMVLTVLSPSWKSARLSENNLRLKKPFKRNRSLNERVLRSLLGPCIDRGRNEFVNYSQKQKTFIDLPQERRSRLFALLSWPKLESSIYAGKTSDCAYVAVAYWQLRSPCDSNNVRSHELSDRFVGGCQVSRPLPIIIHRNAHGTPSCAALFLPRRCSSSASPRYSLYPYSTVVSSPRSLFTTIHAYTHPRTTITVPNKRLQLTDPSTNLTLHFRPFVSQPYISALLCIYARVYMSITFHTYSTARFDQVKFLNLTARCANHRSAWVFSVFTRALQTAFLFKIFLYWIQRLEWSLAKWNRNICGCSNTITLFSH